MKNRLRTVETIMPPNTVVPTEFRLAAPAPVANTNGSTPRINANDVIRMGRRRMRAASTAASVMDIPLCTKLFGELDDQNAVFAGQANQHDHSDLAVNVVQQATGRLGQQRAQ